MIHEFIEIIQSFKNAKNNNLQSVLATVVDLDGSSYRKPGVRMIIHENGTMTGAVSGGCVEKEILMQSDSVFKTGESKMITYDGRYRLGCEGVLYILIEVFDPDEGMLVLFEKYLTKRKPIEINSVYSRELGVNFDYGSYIEFDGKQYFFNKATLSEYKNKEEFKRYKQILAPSFRLLIVGTEHDAVQLCLQASFLGWEVWIIASLSSPHKLNDFPGAKQIIHTSPGTLDLSLMDDHTAIVLMTHHYAKDLQFLSVLKDSIPVYIGLLGATHRRERLLHEFIESYPNINDSFLDIIYAPTGLNIGAVTPQEIALTICAEILSVLRRKVPKSLKNLTGVIHHRALLNDE